MEAQIERTGGKTMTKLVEEVAQTIRDTKRDGAFIDQAAQAAIAKVFDWLRSYNNSNYSSPTVSEFMRVARKEALGEEK
jgi:hypothetical protein